MSLSPIQSNAVKGSLIQRFNRMRNHTFKNWFMGILLTSGIGFVGYQKLLDKLSSFEFISTNLIMRFSPSQETDWFLRGLGTIMILSACIFFYLINKDAKNTKPVKDKKLVTDTDIVFQTLKEASPEIRKYLDDNRRIFINFSPNSSANSVSKDMMDDGLWKASKQKIICPNNSKIKAIISNIKGESKKETIVIEKMLNHIDAFGMHCDEPNFDYSNHKFSLDFSDMIYKYCRQISKNKNRINEYSDWLESEVSTHSLEIVSIIFFGSALYGEEKFDVDCLIKNKANSVNAVEMEASKWQLIMNNFKETFNIKLHLTVLSKMEEKTYADFISKLPAHQLTHQEVKI